ncbi:MAG: hypothetical protein JW704_09330 [Anaerolineaceae bacterium]|nr:hypothetical protein [Anaerolineaceae bacterium]MBN2677575.1 hypothetical protein [Anaerolineaceae bacterium]
MIRMAVVGGKVGKGKKTLASSLLLSLIDQALVWFLISEFEVPHAMGSLPASNVKMVSFPEIVKTGDSGLQFLNQGDLII